MESRNFSFPETGQTKNVQLKKIIDQLNIADEELLITKKELFRRQSDFADFSYAISHTLRKNIANIKGLLNLLNDVHLPEEAISYLGILTDEVNQLDDEVYGLNEVIRLQYAYFDIKEIVNLKIKLSKILNLFSIPLEKCNAQIVSNFDAFEKVFTIRSLMGNVFQELIANAIKFKHPKRDLKISIGTFISKDRMGIEVTDNGIGIDLEKYKNQIFVPFKKINPNTKGKGIGLFLLKQQLDIIGGNIHIVSTPNEGTTIRVYLENQSQISDILLDSPVVRIIYQKEDDLMIANWKRTINGNEFREIFTYLIKLMQDYKLKYWIANTLLANNDEKELNAVRKIYAEKIKKVNLKKMALVMPKNEMSEEDLLNRKADLEKVYPFKINLVGSLEEAMNWIKEQ